VRYFGKLRISQLVGDNANKMRKDIAKSDNKELNDFVFASKFMQTAKAKL